MRWGEIICEVKVNPSKAVLLKNGWREIGQGTYASVFEHPNEDHILKLFSSADTAYLEFVHFAKQHPNEHFPQFGKIIQINAGFFTVETERLQPITTDYRKQIRLIGSLVALLKYRSYETIVKMVRDEEGYDRWQEFIDYLDHHPTMKAAIFSLMPLLTKHFCDLGESNFMLRGTVIVFTDPVETIRQTDGATGA